MATFVQQPSGSWKAIIRIQGQPLKTKTFKLKKLAQEWATTTERELKECSAEELEQCMSFSDVWPFYYEDVVKRLKRPQNELKHWLF
ncbi:hypothetical protein [Endozoicomonas atrinae]|uniref:hypothetical protein n=1 Tax=Endozoicomonas atrinae TaxID=1333660 RepID=UPI003AFFE41F